MDFSFSSSERWRRDLIFLKMDPRFLIVDSGLELALRPSSSAPYATFSLSVEAASLRSGLPVAGFTVFVGSGTLAAVAGSGTGTGFVAVGGTETIGIGSGVVAVGLGGAVSFAVGETTLGSDSTGISDGRPSTGGVETAFLPSAAAGRSEGNFP